MDSRSLIRCSNLTVHFKNEVVLDRFSFDVDKNKHTVLKGESGSGKSTLLKLLLGFLEPTKGTIQYKNGNGIRTIRQHTAWLPQDLDLGDGTVEEVILKPFQFIHNNSNKPGKETYGATLSSLGLRERNLQKQFRNLSTGQRQRVGLAVCHLLDKPILLLDEPTSALDTISKQRVSKLLLEHTNKTVISTSHDPFWLERADKIIPLD